MDLLTVTGAGSADATGAATIICNPSGGPIGGSGWLLQYFEVESSPNRPGMVVRIRAGLNGTPIAPPGTGAVQGFTQVFHPGGGDLILEVSGLQPGDLISANGTGLAGWLPDVAELAAQAPAAVVNLAGGTEQIGAAPTASTAFRVRHGGAGTETLIFANPGQQLYLWHLMIVGISSPTAGSRIHDPINNVELLQYAPELAPHPLPLPCYGVLQSTCPGTPVPNVVIPTSVLEANIGIGGGVYDFYVVYSLLG